MAFRGHARLDRVWLRFFSVASHRKIEKPGSPVRASVCCDLYAHISARGIPVSINSHHLMLLVAIFVACLVAFWRLIFKTRKFKFNINLDRDLAISDGLSNLIAGQSVRFKIVGKCLTHRINPEWKREVI
jgi:hypothetical protein